MVLDLILGSMLYAQTSFQPHRSSPYNIPKCPSRQEAAEAVPHGNIENVIGETSYYHVLDVRPKNDPHSFFSDSIGSFFTIQAYRLNSRNDRVNKMDYDEFIEFIKLQEFDMIQIYERIAPKRLSRKPSAIIYKDKKSGMIYIMIDLQLHLPVRHVDMLFCGNKFDSSVIVLAVSYILENKRRQMPPLVPPSTTPQKRIFN